MDHHLPANMTIKNVAASVEAWLQHDTQLFGGQERVYSDGRLWRCAGRGVRACSKWDLLAS